MADAARNITIKVLLDEAKARMGLKQLGDDAEDTGTRWSKMGSMAKAGVALAGAAVVSFLADAAKAAIEDEKSQRMLALALENTTGATKEQVAATEEWIDGMSRSRGVADDELRPALANLVRATGDVETAQDDLAVAMDIAAARGIDVNTVTLAMSKAAQGNVGALGRLGVATKDTAGETMTYDEVLKEASRTMGGAAMEASMSLEGQLKRQQIAWEETKETVGSQVIPILSEVGDVLSSFVTGIAGPTERSINNMQLLFRDLAAKGIDPAVDKMRSLVAILVEAEKIFPVTSDAVKVLIGMLDLEGKSLQEATRYLEDHGTELGLNEKELQNVIAQLNIQDQAARDAARGLGVHRDALGETTAATYDQITATKELTDPLYNLLSTNERLATAEDKYNDALFTNGVNSKEAEKAAIDLTKAQQDANIAAARYAEEGGSASVEELRKLAEQAGLSDAAIDRLIGTIGRANSSTVKIPTRTYGGRPQEFQEGGVVAGPHGSPQMALVHAGETILPTHKAGHRPGLSANITINAGMGSDPNAISKAVVEALQRYERANGVIPVRTR